VLPEAALVEQVSATLPVVHTSVDVDGVISVRFHAMDAGT
jgi:hypothetical protein